ncbi:hypothetical protein Tco_0576946 [Tanacetum coccineum]
MARHYTQPKRPRNYAWFKEKLMLVKAQEADLDAYDSDCDDISSAKAVLMANLSTCDSDALSKAFGRNIRDLGSFGEETDKLLYDQPLKKTHEICATEPRDVLGIIVGIWLSIDRCSYHTLSEDQTNTSKDFLKLVDLLDLDGELMERTRLRLFQFSLRDQASNWLERLQSGSNTIIEDHTTVFLPQFLSTWEGPAKLLLGRTAKLRNDMLMFQQNHRLVSRTYSKKSLIMASIVGFKSKFFMIMSPFILSARLTAPLTANSIIRMPTNLRKSLRTSLSTTMRAGMTRKNSDYMASHTERMKRFKNAIFKQREEINKRMTEMFRLLKKLMTSRTPEKVLIREEAKFPVTMNVNSISLARGEEERSDKTDETLDNTVKPIVTDTEIPMKEAERNNETKNKPIKKAEEKEVVEVLSS